MGFWGWDEIQDGVTLKGTVADTPHVAGDDDWNFNVIPAHGFKRLLMNPSNNTNQNGRIECEVEPPQHLKDLGQDVETDAVADQMLGSPNGKWVTVTGTWSVDKSHTVYGEDLNDPTAGGNSTLGKTEIHPITSVLVEQPPAADNSSRTIDFLVFSDDSANVPAHVPHSHENRGASISIPIPSGSTFTILAELDRSQSKSITSQDSARVRTVKVEVASGKPDDKKGFYHVTIALPGFTLLTFLLSRGSDPSKGIREMMHRAETTSLRKLFQRLDAGALPPLPCAAILNKMAPIEAEIAKITPKHVGRGPRPPRSPKLQQLLDELKPLFEQAQALGCWE